MRPKREGGVDKPHSKRVDAAVHRGGQQRTALTVPSVSGPAGPYVHAVAVREGSLVFTSGVVARDATGAVAGGDIRAQTRLVFERARAILGQAGGDLTDIVKMTAYLRDRTDYAALNEVRHEVLSGVEYASTTVICDFPAAGALVEIEFVAHLVTGGTKS